MRPPFYCLEEFMQVLSLVGKKVGQKQGFLQNGKRIPLTAVNVMGNLITQIKTEGSEGYTAIQVGMDIKKRPGKRDLNRAKQAGLDNAPRFFKEIIVDDVEGATLGSQLNVSEIFTPGDIIDVTGTSKGKGFAGGVKRHGFKGGPRTHGQSDRERAPGSIGQATTPGRVYKGKKMAGRMGTGTVTVKNLEIIEVTADGVLLIKGLVPGNLNGYLTIKKVGENKKFVPLYREEIKEDGGIASESLQEDASSSSSSDDAQPVQDGTQKSDEASLSNSRQDTKDETKENGETPISSSEGEQAPVVSQSNVEQKQEVKEELGVQTQQTEIKAEDKIEEKGGSPANA